MTAPFLKVHLQFSLSQTQVAAVLNLFTKLSWYPPMHSIDTTEAFSVFLETFFMKYLARLPVEFKSIQLPARVGCSMRLSGQMLSPLVVDVGFTVVVGGVVGRGVVGFLVVVGGGCVYLWFRRGKSVQKDLRLQKDYANSK